MGMRQTAISPRREARLEALLRDHDGAVREFADLANAVADSRWLIPRAVEKWTPAQETQHLILTYDAFRRDLSGEGAMALRGTPLRRWLWRTIGMTSILVRKRIPVAVRAPREARPAWVDAPRAELVSRLESRAHDFEVLFARAWRGEPRRGMTHPLFGTVGLDQAIRLIAVHTRHHAAFLPRRDR
jgi:hypothetical protein